MKNKQITLVQTYKDNFKILNPEELTKENIFLKIFTYSKEFKITNEDIKEYFEHNLNLINISAKIEKHYSYIDAGVVSWKENTKSKQQLENYVESIHTHTFPIASLAFGITGIIATTVYNELLAGTTLLGAGIVIDLLRHGYNYFTNNYTIKKTKKALTIIQNLSKKIMNTNIETEFIPENKLLVDKYESLEKKLQEFNSTTPLTAYEELNKQLITNVSQYIED